MLSLYGSKPLLLLASIFNDIFFWLMGVEVGPSSSIFCIVPSASAIYIMIRCCGR